LEVGLPLIASGYLWLVVGLLLGFAGYAWIGVVISALVLIASAVNRDVRIASLALMLLGGAMGGLESAKPAIQVARAGRPEHPTMLDAARLRSSRSIDKLFGRDAPMAKALAHRRST
jgi:hypothetical protein